METRCIIVVLRRGLSLDMSEGPPASLWHVCALRCTKACFGAEKMTLGISPISAVLLLHVLCRYLPLCHSCAPLYPGTESAGQYFELSLSAYKNSAGPHDPGFLAAQDDFCRHLLSNGHQKVKHTHLPTVCACRKTTT